ncbi:MAG: class I SAM-dependent methyltransferase [Candidatus Altiarchaeota archaeon]
MNVSPVERAFLNSFVWSLIQKGYVVPFWRGLFSLSSDSVVLEVGCGRGVGSIILAESFKPARLDALDLDERMVAKARDYVSGEYSGRINIVLGDVTRMSAQDGGYDAVFDFLTMHYVENWQDGLAEVSRVLKPGGYFAFCELYDGGSSNPLAKLMLGHKAGWRFGRRDWVRALAENHMRLLEEKKHLAGYGMIGVARKS